MAADVQCVHIQFDPKCQIVHTIHTNDTETHGPRCQCCGFSADIAVHANRCLNLLHTLHTLQTPQAAKTPQAAQTVHILF